MASFLPACIQLETYSRYLLDLAPARRQSCALNIRWYDRAVWAFIEKIVDGVKISEISEPWLLRIPEAAYRRQLRRARDHEERAFLRDYLSARNEADLVPPSEG